MEADSKKKLQLALIVALIVAGGRTAFILYQRHADAARDNQPKREVALNRDYYVTPRKLHPYDLKSARELTAQPVWVKEGYRYTYYPYSTGTHSVNFSHAAGTLLPLQKLAITDVVTASAPQAPSDVQVMAVFEEDGKNYAFPIGSRQDGNFQIYSDEILFIEDPRQLYKHWPAEVWEAIGQHVVKPGMNELQADFAIGMGVPEGSGQGAVRVVKYPNGGKPTTITYRNGRAAEIQQ